MPRYSKKGRVPFEKTAFGGLPPEIRAKIYEHALQVPVPANSRRFPYFRPRHAYPAGHRKDGLVWYDPSTLQITTRPSKWLKMLQVCRQMFSEAVRVWFQVNCLQFSYQTYLINMKNLNPVRFSYLKTIHIRELNGQPANLFEALSHCTSLSSLEIRLFEWNGFAHNNTGWLLQCDNPRVEKAVDQVRGLQHMEFIVSEFLPIPQLGRKEFWVDKLLYVGGDWTRKHLDIANELKAKMLRPKIDTTPTEMLEYCKNRKRYLEDVNGMGDAKRRRIEE
ncbi:MAG: hypothetical protein Q9174_004385 [Haloplaca sp. 1 TL-2023]